jgi:hypothetical protein
VSLFRRFEALETTSRHRDWRFAHENLPLVAHIPRCGTLNNDLSAKERSNQRHLISSCGNHAYNWYALGLLAFRMHSAKYASERAQVSVRLVP